MGHPTVNSGIKGRQPPGIHPHDKPLRLPRLQQTSLGIGTQLGMRFFQSIVRRRNIKLHHFLAGTTTGVGDNDRGGKARILTCQFQTPVLEAGIGKAVSKGIGHLDTLGVEVAIANPDVITVIHLCSTVVDDNATAGRRIRTQQRHAGEVLSGGIVLQIECKGIGQLAGRVHLAGQDVRHGMAGFLPRLPGQQNGINLIAPAGYLDDTADVQHHHNRLAGLVKGGRDIPDERLFGFRQIEVTFSLAVDELTGIPADRDEADIIGRSGSVDLLDGRHQLRQRGRCQEGIGFRTTCLCGLDVFGIGLRKYVVSGVAGIL